MTISNEAWAKYISRLKAINDTAVAEMAKTLGYVNIASIPADQRQELIDYAYRLTKKYGEAAGALACEMYDALSELSGKFYEPAIPAETASIGEVAKAVTGTLKTQNPDVVSQAIGRLVKMAGSDTIVKNAIRDHAQTAWVVMGDTCAFCIALASRGWEYASTNDLDNGHSKHIHSNCDCMYAVRFDDSTNVKGYDPNRYAKMYYNASGGSSKDKINAMRREFYAENREKIREQQRTAYEKRKELNGSVAEETDV